MQLSAGKLHSSYAGNSSLLLSGGERLLAEKASAEVSIGAESLIARFLPQGVPMLVVATAKCR